MKKLILIAFTFFAFSSFQQLCAQMSGNVTINSGATADSTHFKNWYSFWRSLQGLSRSDGGPTLPAGIKGALTVNVLTDHTESASVEFPAISGTGSGKTISIVGNNHYLQFSGPYEVISFKGGDHIRISGLTVRNAGTSAARNTCIRFSNNSDSNEIKNCILEFSGFSTGSLNGSAYIAFSPNDTVLNAAGSTLTGSYNTISNNLCRTTNSGSPGPSFGFAVCGSTSGYSSTAHNNTFTGNTIENFYHSAILNMYSNGNQFYGNNISRANSTSNNCNTVLYGIISQNTYAQSRSTLLRKNTIHDIPYSGCTPSNGVNLFNGFYCTSNTGTSSKPFVVDSNSLTRIAVADNPRAGFFRSSEYCRVHANHTKNIENSSATSEIMVWEFRDGDELIFSNNRMDSCKFSGKVAHYLYTDSIAGSVSGYADILDNLIENNEFSGECYILIPNEGPYRISGNKILGNKITGTNGGYFNGILCQSMENAIVTNNLVANNLGYDGHMGIAMIAFISGSNSCRVWQNTVFSDGDKSPVGSGSYDNNGMYILPFYHSEIDFAGNIIDLRNSGSGITGGIECNDTVALGIWDFNTYHVQNLGWENWVTPLGWMSDFGSYTATGLMGSGENVVNPKFANISTQDFRSYKWQTQNNVKTPAFNEKDINGSNRNKPYSDRGAFEQYADIRALKSGLVIADTVCSGTVISPDITVKNLFSDTAYDFKVSYSINGASKVSQKVSTRLLPGDSVKVSFSNSAILSKPGKTRIAVFVDAGDDNPSNDSFIFNTVVMEAPGGGVITPSSKSTLAIYKTGTAPDITITGQPVIYNMTSPRKYNNSSYNSSWTASAWAETVPGRSSVPTVTYTPPSGSVDQEVKFITNNSNLEDSLIRVCIKITDLINGCDTTSCRNVFVFPRPTADFSAPAQVCGSDTAYFKNLSSIKSGGMEYHWDFGTGKPGDTSNLAEPWFIYASPGTYKVKLTARSVPYGFISADSALISVKTKPAAAFSKTNPCVDIAAVFNNQTTPSGGTYIWNFGDGTTSTQTSPTHKYSTAGGYTVRLFVNLNGCVDSAKASVQAFPMPVADFTYTSPGACDNAPFTFQVKGPVTWGSHASYWDFGNGNTSSQASPTFTFGNGGTQTVKLLLITAFGCRDSVAKNLILKTAPKVSFIHTEACTIDSTQFTNTTPPVSGAIPNYKWYFGDGNSSAAQNPWHRWTGTGNRIVRLVVKLDNGCADSIDKSITVRTQAVPMFADNSPVCSGSTVNFDNETTWNSGQISYEWNTGDGNFYQTSDPQHLYTVNQTTTYHVTLCASVDSFCKKCYTKPVIVNAIPVTCDFTAEPDYQFGYYGMVFNPKNSSNDTVGPQTGAQYRWTVQNGGTSIGNKIQYDFPNDGTYNVTMCAEIIVTGCSCCITKPVVMNRSGLNLNEVTGIELYPNPGDGNFTLKVSEGEQLKSLEILDLNGRSLHKFRVSGSQAQVNVYLSPGVYQLIAETQAGHKILRLQISQP